MGFTWPMDSLAIIAPIIFIILMIAFPLIGLAAGWKRAAFWGVGNFLFFTIGLLIWKFLGDQMIKPLTQVVTDLIHKIPQCETIEVTHELIKSVLAPFWFLIVMALGELILLINYYAWYKKVVGLKKIKVKNKKTGEVTKQYAKVNPKQATVGYKVGNRIGGFLLLGILTIPSTFAFSQMIYYTTTSSSTRAEKSSKEDPENVKLCLSESLYLDLEKINDALGWFSYYGSGSKSTGSTYDSIFSAIHLLTKQITIDGRTTTVMEEIKTIIGEDIAGMTTALAESIGESGEIIQEKLPEFFSNFATDWNNLIGEASEDMTALFSSDVVVDQLNEAIKPIIESTQEQWGSQEGKFEVTDDIYDAFFTVQEGQEKSKFEEIVDDYQTQGQIFGQDITKFETLNVPQEAFNMVNDMFNGFIDTSNLSGDPEIVEKKAAIVKESFGDILQLIFNPV